MAVITRAQALTRANEIRTETLAGANSAERVGSLLRDLGESLAMDTLARCSVALASDAALTAASGFQAINWDGADLIDPTAMHSPTVNPSRITIAAAGDYEFGSSLLVNGAAGHNSIIRLSAGSLTIAAGAGRQTGGSTGSWSGPGGMRHFNEIGRASCRERWKIWVVYDTLYIIAFKRDVTWHMMR